MPKLGERLSDRLPPDFQNLLEPHFSGEEKGFSTSIRLSPTLERAIDLTLQRLSQYGEGEYFKFRTQILQQGAWLFCKLVNDALDDPPDELRAILMVDAIEAKAKVRASTTEKMKSAVEKTSDHVERLRKERGAEEEIRGVLEALLRQVESMPDGFWKGRYRKMIAEDKVLSWAIPGVGIEWPYVDGGV